MAAFFYTVYQRAILEILKRLAQMGSRTANAIADATYHKGIFYGTPQAILFAFQATQEQVHCIIREIRSQGLRGMKELFKEPNHFPKNFIEIFLDTNSF